MQEFDFGTLLKRLDNIRDYGSKTSAFMAMNFTEMELPTLFCWILDRLESDHGIDSHSILEHVHRIFPEVYELNQSLIDGDDSEWYPFDDAEEWDADE